MIATSFGLDAASVVAVVGSAGVALGLALQGSLSNFAGGVLILLLKPFKVGDYIIEDTKGNEGTVSEIQLFYTKLTTPDERIVILPNGTLANSSLTNVTTTYKRRLTIKVGISYYANLQKAKEVMQGTVAKDKGVLTEEEVVTFVDELGDSAVVIGTHCYVANADYWTVRWRLLEEIKLAFDAEGIEIPYQQMDVHVDTRHAVEQ
jgi:small conductance mechanosensitive channel